MSKSYTEEQVRQLLREAIAKAGSQKKWAKRHKYSRSFVGNVALGNKPIPDKILRALKLKKHVIYTSTKRHEYNWTII